MSSPDPAITVYNNTCTPTVPLELGKPPTEVTTWSVRLFPQLNEAEGTELLVSKDPIPSESDSDFLAAFSYHPDGAIYLEAYSDSHPVYVCNNTTNTHRTIRTKLRKSTLAATNPEHYYFILIQDCTVEVEGVTHGQLRFTYSAPEPFHPRAPVAPMAHPPQIQVMHSILQQESSYTANNGIGGFRDMISTPAMTNEESVPKIYETPAVKSRHVDPNSSPRRRPQSSPSSGRIQQSKSGIMVAGVPDNIGDFTDDESEDEVMDFVPTAPMDIGYNILGEDVSGDLGTGVPSPLCTTSPPEPIESPIIECVSPKAVVGDLEDLDLPEAEHVDNTLPDSLPEVFHYVEKKNKNRELKYGKKGVRRSAVRGARITEEPEELEDGSAPMAAAQRKGNRRKRKVHEETSAVSTKKRKGESGTPLGEEDDDADDESPPPKIARGKGRGKRNAEAVPHSTEDNVPFSIAPEESSAAEDKAQNGRRNPIAKAAPIRKGEKPLPKKKGSSQFNTQYTLPDDEEETTSGSEDDPAPKTPKARGKAAISGKTPATAKKTPAPSKSAARKSTTRSTASPEPPETKPLRTQDVYDGTPPRISFTNSDLAQSKSIKSFIRSHGSKTVSSPSDPSCNYLVHGPGELKRTSKIVIAVARGIKIVEEQWLLDSQTAGYWVDPDPYIPSPPKEWDISLPEALDRGRKGKTNVLKGKTIFLTPSLLAHLKQLKSEGPLLDMLKAAGAEHVHKKAPRGEVVGDSMVLGKDEGDKDLDMLDNGGWKVYGMAIVGLSVLRGKLVEGDEFLVKPGERELETKKRGWRKSMV